MFTIEEIKEAHSKVKSGADFPNYIKAIKLLGVEFYETYVSDGHAEYFGANDYKTSSPAKYSILDIAQSYDIEQFKSELKAHQQGKTDYLTFINMCANAGVYKWVVSLEKMTCTYYDISGKEVLVENIPQ